MTGLRQHRIWISSANPRASAFLLALAIVFTLTMVAAPTVQAQTFKVIYNFTGQHDGGHPGGSLAIDRAGNLYGAAYAFGEYDVGTVFRLQPKNSSWVFNPIYTFTAGADGAYPVGATLGPDGSIYGATYFGGDGAGCGVVFNVKPPPTRPASPLAPWNETVLHTFKGGDGCGPNSGVTFDKSGNLYGTTPNNGPYNGGTIYQLTRSGSGWTENTIHGFGAGDEGDYPIGPVVFDSAGNLYGAAAFGGPSDSGTIFQMTPTGSGWTLNVLTDFPQSSDGFRPYGSVIVDQSGNVYGTTSGGGAGKGGTVFILTSGAWTFTLLYSFTGDYGGPGAPLTMDAAGNLYGTTGSDGAYQQGNVFKLTPSNGGWTYTDLYDFTGGTDGGGPSSNLVFDENGNLYGLTDGGGTGVNCDFGCGVVFEITP
jgi:uncharacterized repeat protein (TIGR03803 family)